MHLGKREILFLVLILAMPLASYHFVFQPRNRQIAQARAEVHRKQARLHELETATMGIEDLGAEIDKLTHAIAVFEQKLPAEREVEVILKDVWDLASRHRLTPKSFRTEKPISAAGYAEQEIPMTIIGDFEGFYRFLQDLEKLPRTTQVRRMKLKKDAQEEGHISAELVLTVFFESRKAPASHGLLLKGGA